MATAGGKTEYELERDRRIAENKRKMEELGVTDAAAALASSKPAPKRQKKAKAAVPEELLERRVSSRERKAINYCEMEARTAREPRAPVDHSERIKAMTLDKDTAEQLRKEMESKKGSSKSGGKARGPVDSGKGVRIQGGRVYDSAHGVTCHWCRQKTLEDHVTCTNSNCGGGRRMPLSFCAKCLRNRHGEDCAAAEASNAWWCPCCRGSCGAGCVGCCNCGLCRKKAGLEPTHQVVRLARDAGFDNVHDYLVHLVTGEDKEVIAARKLAFPWGRWLKEGFVPGDRDEEEGGGSSEASAQTEGKARGSSPLSDDLDQDADKDQAPTTSAAAAAAAAGGGRKGRGGKAATAKGRKGAAAAAPPAKKAAAGGKKKKRGKAAAASEVELSAKQQQDEEAARAAAAEEEEQQEEQQEEDDDVPMLSSQDMTLPRKQRIMQALGLAPVTVITKA